MKNMKDKLFPSTEEFQKINEQKADTEKIKRALLNLDRYDYDMSSDHGNPEFDKDSHGEFVYWADIEKIIKSIK